MCEHHLSVELRFISVSERDEFPPVRFEAAYVPNSQSTRNCMHDFNFVYVLHAMR